MKKEILGNPRLFDFSLPNRAGRCPNAATVTTASESSAASTRTTPGHATASRVLLPIRGQGIFDWSSSVRL